MGEVVRPREVTIERHVQEWFRPWTQRQANFADDLPSTYAE